MANDLKIALRRLSRSPGFTCTALATLALCIGANTAILAVVDAVLVRPLPFPGSGRLLTLYYTYPKLPSASDGASLATYFERRGKIPALASISAISTATSVVGETGSTSIENLGRVTSEFFATLGVRPLIGRVFTDSEMTYQTDHVALLSYEFWRSRYNADPGVLGKPIRMDGIPRVIVGVLPPGFRFLSFRAPVYMPLSSEEAERNVGARHNLNTTQIARLRDGARVADAQAQIDADDARHAPEFPQAQLVKDAGCHTVVAPLHADFVASVRPTLLLLQAAALVLLLIGCVNLVNLLVIRASNRAHEVAVRQALGASPGYVVRDAMTETVLLTAAGGLLGLFAGYMGIRLLAAFGAEQLPLGAEISFNGRLAAAALFSALIIGAAIGAPVAWFNLRGRLASALQSETRGGTAGIAAQRLRSTFIVLQVALSFVLLSGAGLLGLSLKHATEVPPGFRPDHVITGQFKLSWNGYRDLGSFRRFFDRLQEKAGSIPGVSAIGVISNVPVTGVHDGEVMTVPGHEPVNGEKIAVHDRFGVAGDYFRAMGIPLRAGRLLDWDDAHRDQRVCVVDETFAGHYWPMGGAVGKLVYQGTEVGDGNKPYTVVGVVGAVKQASLTEAKGRGSVYIPYSSTFYRDYFLVARTTLPPDSLATTLAKVVREADPEIPLNDIRTMDVRIGDSLAARRTPALMAGIFGAAALMLATIGLYGVMAYSVSQRTREFGVRMALGARASDVMRLVLGQGVRLVAVGLASGSLAALLVTRRLAPLLFGVQEHDPLAFTAVALALAVVTVLACLLPARRATKVDPMVALRAE